MIDGAGSQAAVRGSSSTALEFCAETDSPLERTGFELAVPPRRRDGQCYGVRSLKRRLDRRGMTSGTARNGLRFQLVLLRKPFHASDGPFWSGGLRRAVPSSRRLSKAMILAGEACPTTLGEGG